MSGLGSGVVAESSGTVVVMGKTYTSSCPGPCDGGREIGLLERAYALAFYRPAR